MRNPHLGAVLSAGLRCTGRVLPLLALHLARQSLPHKAWACRVGPSKTLGHCRSYLEGEAGLVPASEDSVAVCCGR